jgi:hypothetical protein
MLTEAIKLGIDGVRFAGAEQTLVGDTSGRDAVVDFEEGGGAFPEVGFGAMVTQFLEGQAFGLGQGKGTCHSERGLRLGNINRR